jgi:hypothetical protein
MARHARRSGSIDRFFSWTGDAVGGCAIAGRPNDPPENLPDTDSPNGDHNSRGLDMLLGEVQLTLNFLHMASQGRAQPFVPLK